MSLWSGFASTLEHQRLLDASRRAIGRWLAGCQRPIVSVSGGKDSVLTLALCREQAPNIPAIRADPPNPLPDRQDHVDAVAGYFGGRWIVEAYPWDVASVLAGDIPYPSGLKVRHLEARHRIEGIDGLAMGIRGAESNGRAHSIRCHGLVHRRADGITTCRPLGWWSAHHVLAEIERRDLPLNPVYTHHEGLGFIDLEHLRDGTWWPHGAGAEKNLVWMRRHYPDVAPLFQRAILLSSREVVV